MLSNANITFLNILSNIEENTIDFFKNVQQSIHNSTKENRDLRNPQNREYRKNRSEFMTEESNEKKRVPLHCMRSDPFTEVCSYLNPKDLCNLRATSKFSNEVISRHSNMYWKSYCWRYYSCSDLRMEATFLLRFLSLRLKDLEMKRDNLTALRRQRLGIDHYLRQNGQGIIGILSDLAWVEDEAIAKTISRKRFMAMATIITTDEGVITRFKDVTKYIAPRSASSFMPHATAVNSLVDKSHIDMLKAKIDAPGLHGYAVNLLQLRPEHEYLRYSVFWLIFKNLMIFDSILNLTNYYDTLTIAVAEDFWATSVDTYEAETEDAFPRLLTRRNDTTLGADARVTYNIYSSGKGSNSGSSVDDILAKLVQEIKNARHSYTVLRYT